MNFGLIHQKLMLLSMAALLFWGCRSKIEVKVDGSAPAGLTEGAATAPMTTTVPPVKAAVDPIISLAAEALSESEIRLNWSVDSRSQIMAYRLAYSLGTVAPADCSRGTVIDIPSSHTSYSVNELAAASSYSFRLCALSEKASSAQPNGLTVTETTNGFPSPPEARDLTATATSDAVIELKWTAPEGVTNFRMAYQAGTGAPVSCSAERKRDYRHQL